MKNQEKESKKEKNEKQRGKEMPFPIVGIGASAGGLEALKVFLDHLPKDTGMAFVIIQHLGPGSESGMCDLLRQHTSMKAMPIEDGLKVEPNCIYCLPPRKELHLFHDTFQMQEQLKLSGVSLPIDQFFRSLAEERKEAAICIILSGTGSDGTEGLRAVKAEGGLAMVQDVQEAKYDGMPKSAIATGLVDSVLPVEKMPEKLIEYVKHAHLKKPGKEKILDKEFENYGPKIFRLIRSQTGHDFSQYKKSTAHRRVQKRMALHQIERAEEYFHYLEKEPDEVIKLYQELLIKVTSFFRDPEAFEALAATVVLSIIEGKKDNEPVRIWVPGCSTGEEAYSIAILLAEEMDRQKKDLPVQIFATDIDHEAVEQARSGLYPCNIAADVSAERLQRFFAEEDQTYRVKQEIRNWVTFAIQNLTSDPPFSKLDLVSCRNVLIYMEIELQKRIIPLFHYTLRGGGYLFLGTSESIGEFDDIFSSINSKWKIFQRSQDVPAKATAYPPLYTTDEHRKKNIRTKEHPAEKSNFQEPAERLILEQYAPPSIVIDERFNILYFLGPTNKYLRQNPGKPSFNALDMASEGLRFPLASILHKAFKEKHQVMTEELHLKLDKVYRIVKVVVRPLAGKDDSRNLMMVTFEEKAALKSAKKGKKTGGGREEDPEKLALKQELESLRESHEAIIDELKNSNEELQSSNEELQSAMEEARSTNEELETSKEELQSTNEELSTVNSELSSKVEELTKANNDMNNLLAGTDVGMVFLDKALRIKRFNQPATGVLSLIPEDLGRPVKDIQSKVPQADLHGRAQKVLDTLQNIQFEVQAESGQWYSIRLLPYRTTENIINGVVIVFVDITEMKTSERARIYAESIVDTLREPVLVLGEELKVQLANYAFYRKFMTSPKETLNKHIYDLGGGQWNIPKLREFLEEIIPRNNSFEDFAVSHHFPDLGEKTMLLNACKIYQEGEYKPLILLAIEDITEQKSRQEEMEKTIERLKEQLREKEEKK